MRRRGTNAFTYIEVTITFAIIAVLAAIAVPNFLEAQTRAVVSRSKLDMSLVKSAIETYRFEHRVWPQNATAGVEDTTALIVLTTPIAYLTALPVDSFVKQDSNNARRAATKGPISYRYLNGLQLQPIEGIKLIDSATSNPLTGYGFVGGVLHGMGSDTFNHELQATQEGTVNLTLYDPSNGTTSMGILIQPFP
jgi:type II secretory pathway pseudopilin PulG